MERTTRALSEAAERAVPDSVDLWPGIRSRVESRSPKARAGQAGARRLVVAVTAAAIFALVGIGALLWSQPQPVSAETILAKAQTAGATTHAMQNYHLQSVSRVSVKGNQTTYEEMWYGGNRARSVSEMKDASGKTISSVEMVYDGTQTWIATTIGDQVKVERITGANAKFGPEGLGQIRSLSDILGQYDNSKSCMIAKLDGEATVAGRPTYAIVVEPNPSGCSTVVARTAVAAKQLKESQATNQVAGAKAFKELRVWVDKETFLPLKTVVTDPSNGIIVQSEATSVQYGVSLPSSLFAYTPPSGAIVVDSSDNVSGNAGAAQSR